MSVTKDFFFITVAKISHLRLLAKQASMALAAKALWGSWICKRTSGAAIQRPRGGCWPATGVVLGV